MSSSKAIKKENTFLKDARQIYICSVFLYYST